MVNELKHSDWFKSKPKKLFKDKPKKKTGLKSTPSDKDFTPERALKLAGGMAIVGVGTAVALDLLGDI